MFTRLGVDTLMPTPAAVGPWSADFLHGGAVSALLAGLLDDPSYVVSRLLVDLLAPVPRAPLRTEVGMPSGGRKVVRQDAVLLCGDRAVARASVLRIRTKEVDLPAEATAGRRCFADEVAPPLNAPNRAAARAVGHDSFDSLAMAAHVERLAVGDRVRMWNRLLLPVVPERPPSPLEQVAAACDNASGISARIDFRAWSFVNADLVISLARPPVDGWIALESEGYLAGTGTGQAVSTIHDRGGVLGQKSQSILLERRRYESEETTA